MAVERHLGYYQGSRWLQAGVGVAVLGAVAAGLLSTLNDMQERSEKLAVELTTQYMRTGLKWAIGEALLHGRSSEVASWAGGNPVRYLASPPPGYVGNCTSTDVVALAAGVWCFDEQKQELLYRPRSQKHLVGRGDNAGESPLILRWRVVLVPQPPADDLANINVSVRVATQYGWFE
jgi:hypothetical protein